MYKLTKNLRHTPAFFLLATIIMVGTFSIPSRQQSLAENRIQLPQLNESSTVVATTETSVASQVTATADTTNTAEVNNPAPIASSSKPPSSSENQGLQIDAINLNIPLGTTTLGKNRELLVPANPNKAAWYKQGPKFGQAGTALITGHLDSAAGPGVFWNLRKLKAGDKIEVKRTDGKVFTYSVDKLDVYAQDHTFPWNQVYSTVGSSQLRIITCHGTLNPKTARYSHNLVVYASLIE